MPLGTRVWGIGKVFVLLGALVATFVVFAAIGVRFALRAREVRVPNVVGQPLGDASRLRAALGLTLRVDDARRTDPKIAEGRVALQDPAPGAEARRQRTIRVWLSAGTRQPAVP